MIASDIRVHESDLQLVSSILQRERKATARLVELHSDAVHRYVWRRMDPKVDLVDDIVQEVFMAAWRSLKSYSGEASLQTWLLSIARHKVEDHYRRTLSNRLESMESDETAGDIADPADMEVALQNSQDAERAAGVLLAIPYEYASALRWRYWEGRSSREMAQATGRTEKAVERLLARARERFRQAWLEPKGAL